MIPRPVNCEYRESFSTAVSPSLAERGYEEYLATRASGPLPTAESISPTFTFGSHNLPTPSSSQGSICPAQGPPIEIFQTQQENMQRKSSYCSKINKRPDTPPDSPRVSAKINIDGWHRGGIGDRPLSRQYTTSSQVSRGSSTRKAEWAPLDMPSGESKERLALQRVDSCPPGGFVRSYSTGSFPCFFFSFPFPFFSRSRSYTTFRCPKRNCGSYCSPGKGRQYPKY